MVVKFDLSKDPIIEANPTSYEDFRILMAKFRINMDDSKPTTTKEYVYWRAMIKELRVRAIEQNIDAYSLEVDVHFTIRVAKAEPQIEALKKEMEDAQKVIAAALGTSNYGAVLAAQNAIIDAKKKEINKIEMGLRDGISEDDQKFYHNMVKEAYVVKELLDIRRQRDTATTDEEREVLRARAEKVRLEGIAILEASGQNTEWQRDDLERRVWYMFTGTNIAPPRFGEPDTRTQEQKDLWDGHKALMDSAYKKFKTYSDTGKAGLVPQDELWEQIRQIEDPIIKDIWRERKYETFSGADMVVYFAFPGFKPIDVGLASLIGYTIYREKKQIRTIGAINTKGVTKGPRTISGRMVMTVVREHFVEAIKREIPYMRTIRNMLMDELPPFDILVSFGNEYGAAATLVIHGVTLVDENKNLTVDDLYTENIYTFIARDLDVMKTVFANYKDEYDPMMWMSNSFIPDGSEVLGDFYPKELELTQAAGLMEDPEPFYGTVSGWNATLYNLMYTGVDSSSLAIDSGGNLVNKDTTPSNTDTSKDKDTGSTTPKDTDTTKEHSSSALLWLKGPSAAEIAKRSVVTGGFFGHSSKKARQWNFRVKTTNDIKSTHKKLYDTLVGYGSGLQKLDFAGSDSDLTFELAMYKDSSLKETIDDNYYVSVSWEYFLPETKRVFGIEEKKTSAKNRKLSMLGFWKKGASWSDISKAMKASTSGTAADQKYWINTVSTVTATHGFSAKNLKVGALNASQKKNFLNKSNSNGSVTRIKDNGGKAWIKPGKNGVTINLRNYLWFPSTVNADGYRRMLSYDDLPEDSKVLVKFTYTPNKPSNPDYADGDKRYFYILIKKQKDSKSYDLKNNAFFAGIDTTKKHDRNKWETYNSKNFDS